MSGQAESRSVIESPVDLVVQTWWCVACNKMKQSCVTGPNDDGGDLGQQNQATNGGQMSVTGTGAQQSPQASLNDLISALRRSRDGESLQSNVFLGLAALLLS